LESSKTTIGKEDNGVMFFLGLTLCSLVLQQKIQFTLHVENGAARSTSGDC